MIDTNRAPDTEGHRATVRPAPCTRVHDHVPNGLPPDRAGAGPGRRPAPTAPPRRPGPDAQPRQHRPSTWTGRPAPGPDAQPPARLRADPRLCRSMLARSVTLVFTLISAVLALRLLLPFMRIPQSLEQYVPALVNVSDGLIAPFRMFFQPFALDRLADLPGGELGYTRYLDQVDSTVIVAMIGWAIIGALAVLVLRFLVRAR